MCAFAWLSEPCSRFFTLGASPSCTTVREVAIFRTPFRTAPIFHAIFAPRPRVRVRPLLRFSFLPFAARRCSNCPAAPRPRIARKRRIHSGVSVQTREGAQDQALTFVMTFIRSPYDTRLNNTAALCMHGWPPSPRVRCRCALARLACFTYLLAALAAGAAAAAGRS